MGKRSNLVCVKDLRTKQVLRVPSEEGRRLVKLAMTHAYIPKSVWRKEHPIIKGST